MFVRGAEECIVDTLPILHMSHDLLLLIPHGNKPAIRPDPRAHLLNSAVDASENTSDRAKLVNIKRTYEENVLDISQLPREVLDLALILREVQGEFEEALPLLARHHCLDFL